MRKKLLYLSQVYPYPPDGGGKIKTLNTLLTLSKNFDIFAVFVSERNPSQKEINYLSKKGIKLKVFYNPKILESVKKNLVNLFAHLARGVPHYVFQYTYPPAKKYIEKKINDFQPDIIHIDHINITQYLPEEKKHIWILEQHNLEHFLLWTRFVHTHRLQRKAYLFIEALLTYIFENKAIKKFDHVFAISNEEGQRMRKTFKINNVSVQPLVYKILKIAKRPLDGNKILFIGCQIWPPNENAVEWFINKIFPLITEKNQSAEFHTIGKRNRSLEKRLTIKKNIYLHGYQKSLTPFLQKADVFVLPFRMGGGIRIKALTALSAGIPIVSTSLGIEGLKVKNGKEYLKADNNKSFAQQIVRLLTSKKVRKTMSRYAIEYIKKTHSEKQNSIFLKKYLQITQ